LNKKTTRLIAFFVILLFILTIAAATILPIAKQVKLGLDLQGGFEILYVAKPIDPNGKVTLDSLRETSKLLKKRVDPTGTLEPEINPESPDRIRAKIAGVVDEKAIRDKLKKTAFLSFRDPDGTILMDGRDFVANGADVTYNGTKPTVTIKLKSAAKFKEVTTKVLGKTLAIYLDEEMIANPGVDHVIPQDSAEISGRFTYLEAKELKDTINLGALSLKLEEKYTQSIGATLGLKSLEDTVKAGVIALVIILAGMVVIYRIPGIIACFTLIAFTWLLLLLFVLLNVTLTLPGIAAFVLGIGMAVDSNIITIERIRDEIRSGKSIPSSLRSGNKNSLRTIIDANVTTLLAGAVLYFIGSGSIKGFALTLIFSIVVSIVTNVYLSRLLLYLLVKADFINKPVYFSVKEADVLKRL
jgi:preprotein translocase subunit SecD